MLFYCFFILFFKILQIMKKGVGIIAVIESENITHKNPVKYINKSFPFFGIS